MNCSLPKGETTMGVDYWGGIHYSLLAVQRGGFPIPPKGHLRQQVAFIF
jgi:hypothetical protein